MRASELGIANLQRIVPNLIEWTYREGEDFGEMEELYDALVGQWQRYLGHVATIVGGVHETFRTYEEDAPIFTHVPEDQQRDAMAFLQEYAFQAPEWLIEADILNRIAHAGALERVRRAQVATLDLLLDPRRLARLIEAEVRLGDEAYTPAEMFGDLRLGVWREVQRRQSIDPFRRSLQRGYLEEMASLMTEEAGAVPEGMFDYFLATPVRVSQSDIRPYVRGELESLQREIARALPSIQDRATELHLRDVQARIDVILDPPD